jgi:protein ImuA
MNNRDDLHSRPRDGGERTAVADTSDVPSRPGNVRARVVDELRRLLPRLSEAAGEARALSFGEPVIDAQLQQRGQERGLAFGALHEVVPAHPEDTPSALGFMMALLGRLPRHETMLFVTPSRWLARYGLPYGHGLGGLGLNPGRVIFTQTADDKQTLWAIEEALRASALAAVAGVADALDLKTSQRLQFTAREAGLPLLILRPSKTLEASAATTRWRVGAAEAARDRFGLVTGWRWRLRLERCRNGRGGEWVVEFDHVAHRFSLVATLAGSAVPGGRGTQPITPAERRAG